MTSSKATPIGRTPSGISGRLEAEPVDHIFSAVVLCSLGPGDHFPLGAPREVGMANALDGVSLPVDQALEVMWLSSNGESKPGVEEECGVSPLQCADHFMFGRGCVK